MSDAQRHVWLSPAEYLAGELIADVRHEYVDGEVFAMSGASRRHADICGNIFMSLRPQVRQRGCSGYLNDVKLRVEAANAYYYPDFVVTCAADDRDPYVVHAPSLVIEVLSPSTDSIDRREKRANYAKIPGLQEYLIVEQDERRVDVWRRTAEGWRCETVTAGAIRLDSLDCQLALDDIYA